MARAGAAAAAEPIRFYGHRAGKPFCEFSNFFPAEITTGDGAVWPTTEHLFQARKFVAPLGARAAVRRDYQDHAERIRGAPTPKDAKQLGGRRGCGPPIRADWEQVKDGEMLNALVLKFRQHPPLAAVLLGTADAPLEENAPRDRYWGTGGAGRGGLNMLGRLLEVVRAKLQH
jgi:hypothetical protein